MIKVSSSLKSIIFRIGMTIALLTLVTPLIVRGAIAQSAFDGYTIYLPLVSKTSQEWLDLFNQYRRQAGLNPVVEIDNINYGVSLHTKYMLLNPDQSNWHTEYRGEPGYTDAGNISASQSNMLWSNSPTYTDKQAIDLWMRTERHRYHLLNPYLQQSGYNLACDGVNCFAGLNIYGGVEYENVIRNVVYPSENHVNFPRSGFPITWSFYPYFLINEFSSPSITMKDNNGNIVSGTINLHNDHVKELGFIPNSELLANHRYEITMKISVNGNDQIKTWNFTTGSN